MPRPIDPEGSRSNPMRFLDQDYEELHRDFVKHRARFIDDTFPPNASSIGEGLLSDEYMDTVEWIRPTKMVQDPQLVVGGESRFDLAQGELALGLDLMMPVPKTPCSKGGSGLGSQCCANCATLLRLSQGVLNLQISPGHTDHRNCWFLAAIAAITFRKHIIDEVIPEGQSFQNPYAGIFHFRFWRFGKWVDVVIDDKLPTINGQLIFVHCKTRNEFWPALLEKAYAKVCGSYADLHGGLISEALCDFTGGVFMTLRPKAERPEHWGLMRRAAQYKALMGCGTRQGATPANTELPNGIVEGHAYTVTDVTQVMSNGEPVKLVRLLNPWGRREWNRAWSDTSSLWGTVSTEDRTDLLHNKDDGEFWMSMEDFCRYFVNVDICCESPAFLDGSSPRSWTTLRYEGYWDRRTSGGPFEYTQTFWMNPQFQVKIPALDTGAESQKFNLLVSLMQKPNSRHRRQVTPIPIGFSLFTIPPEMRNEKAFPASFFASRSPLTETQVQTSKREEFFRLRPGRYLIVPFTCKPSIPANFLLIINSKIQPEH